MQQSSYDLAGDARPDWFEDASVLVTTFTTENSVVTEIIHWPISCTFVRPATTQSTPSQPGATGMGSSCVSMSSLRGNLHP